MLLAVILNVKVYIVVFIVLLAVLVVIGRAYNVPTKRCPSCGGDVPVGNSVCAHCGYKYDSFRTSR